jgi:hypothetical protein
MEPFIAVLIVIGMLMVGGNSADETATRSSGESATATTLADGDAQGRLVCDNKGSRRRDLTVPYASRLAPASVDAEACDE